MIDQIIHELSDLRKNLHNHRIYSTLKNTKDVRIFMELHVYAVWDFMSLLKSLQQSLTQLQVPWIPAKNAVLARFINEIILGEESDLNELNHPRSHFEMYLEAMKEMGADTSKIDYLIGEITRGTAVEKALDYVQLEKRVVDFTKYTFQIISTQKTHLIAAAFTFGREDIIPDMFNEILSEGDIDKKKFNKITYYLNRHIELDGDEHGPLSLQMVTELCGEDTKKWKEVLVVAKESIKYRISLWDAISDKISEQ
tara:strand:- start:25 stop:786 length:762 start_codon:yes stop_codon:yes gene_type:complete